MSAEPGAGSAAQEAPILSVRGLTMRFGNFTAVDHVDLDVAEGQIHALVGPNGAGKSTLLNLLGGQLLQTSGEIRFLGRVLGASTPHVRARLGIGRSFQLTSVIPGFSCLENVVLAVEARRGMLRALRLHSAEDDLRRARELLELTSLGDQADLAVEALGHGRQKQLEVAMALGAAPRVLLLDEPTSGLTESERRTLGALLQRVAATSTIVMAEHDVGFVRRVATRVTALNLGRKIAQGSADEVFQAAEVRQVFLRGVEDA
jgi:branched-chain amino acid transport system ATP-binding protein